MAKTILAVGVLVVLLTAVVNGQVRGRGRPGWANNGRRGSGSADSGPAASQESSPEQASDGDSLGAVSPEKQSTDFPEIPEFVEGMEVDETDEEITEGEDTAVDSPAEEGQEEEKDAEACKQPPKPFPPYQPPDGRTLEEWMSTYGMSQKQFTRVKNLVYRLKRKEAKALGKEFTKEQMGDDIRYGGVVMTYNQLRKMLRDRKNHRQKRKTINFDNYNFNKWPSTTINYVISPSHTSADVLMIRAALAEIEATTCIRFAETNTGRYLYFVPSQGCWSYLGRTGTSGPQLISLQTGGCTATLGVPIHEVLHALGLYHEQSRPDRDSYVTVNLNNVIDGYTDQFQKQTYYTASTHGIPYDYGSLMHYGAGDFSISSSPVITTIDPGHQQTIGQRVTLSWHDAKAVNVVYCSATCGGFPALTCSNGGYMDPNTCTSCICPEGFGGLLCDMAAGNNGACSPAENNIMIDHTNEICVHSRNYGNGVYNNGDNCAYLFTAPQGCTLCSRFDGVFGTHCYKQNTFPACYQWVEIKTNADMTERGYRFCCPGSANLASLTSDTNKLLVHFDATYPRTSNSYTAGDLYPGASSRTGFKVCVRIQDPTCLPEPLVSTVPPPPPTTTMPPTTEAPTTVPTTPVLIGCRFKCQRTFDFYCFSRTPCNLYYCCLYRNPDGTYFRRCRFIMRRCV